MNSVLILGANGRFGQAATQAFANAGWQVLAQVRRAPVAPAQSRVTHLALPMADTAALARAAAGAQAVIHAVNPVYTRWDAEAMPLLQQGLAVARVLGARFMLPGNVYNFGTHLPALLREDTPQHADTPKGRMRVAMEGAMKAAAAQGTPGVVIRAGDFFGCGSGSWLDQAVARNIAKGRLAFPGPLELQHAWAYLPDLAAAFVAVAARPPAQAFEVLHFAGHNVSGREFLAALDSAAAGLGLRPEQGFKVGGMPWGVMRAIGLVHPLWRELARMSYLWRMPHAMDGSRLAARVVLPPATPLQAALRQSLIDLGHAPQALQPALT